MLVKLPDRDRHGVSPDGLLDSAHDLFGKPLHTFPDHALGLSA
jgi:hypothetical protein